MLGQSYFDEDETWLGGRIQIFVVAFEDILESLLISEIEHFNG